MVLSAQMAKAGPPMNGKDLHVGDMGYGILPASAPLTIGTLTVAGMAMAFAREGSDRVALSFIGEGGSSLGEWHEAINLCAARRLPAVFCIENNQTALSTPVRDQSAVRVFADKAVGYGIPGITIDGTDPDEVAAAFAWAIARARQGHGPTLVELICMRMCGHAHHDDMLYLGKDPQPSWDYPPVVDQGYADRELYAFWSARDPIPAYAARLEAEGLIAKGHLDELKREAEEIVEARGARRDRCAVAGSRGRWTRRAGQRSSETPHRSPRSVDSSVGRFRSRPAGRRRRPARSIARAARSSKRSCWDWAMRSVPPRGSSCMARTSAASTAMPSSCSGRC